jgi:TrmH family RNA methyltransferase
MPVAALILVETSLAGNLGSSIRVAANFGVERIELVRPGVDPSDPEVDRWACGGVGRICIRCHATFADAAARYRTVVASASGRGRRNQPLITPREAVMELCRRGASGAALAFGNETRGLRREDIDRCDLVVRVPTVPDFPVLNLTQAIAIVLGYLGAELSIPEETGPVPASQRRVDDLMAHLHRSLSAIGFLDPSSPERILRKLRRLFGRAGISDNEVAILRGICRQMEWAARTRPLAGARSQADTHGDSDQ